MRGVLDAWVLPGLLPTRLLVFTTAPKGVVGLYKGVPPKGVVRLRHLYIVNALNSMVNWFANNVKTATANSPSALHWKYYYYCHAHRTHDITKAHSN